MNNRTLQPTGLWGWSWEFRLTRGIGRVISASLPAEQPGLIEETVACAGVPV